MTTEQYTPDTARWDAFVDWARRFYEWEDFAERERDYKLELGAALAEAREAFLSDSPDWGERLTAAVEHPVNNLTHAGNWRLAEDFLDLVQSDSPLLREGLRRLWDTTDSTAQERVRGFIESVADTPLGGPESMASFLLMGRNATNYPFYRFTPLSRAYGLTGYPGINLRTAAEKKYEHAIGFLAEFIAQAAERGLRIADQLDAQSLVWCVTSPGHRPEDWPDDVLTALDAYRESGGAHVVPSNGEPEPADVPEAASGSPDWPELAAKLLWEQHELEEIVADLEDKRQMIFYGPPGTGKTYVAKAIAAEYAGAGGGFEIVQFHPSYSYEDFVEGYRPALSDSGQPGFTLTQGPLRRIAADAEANPDATYVLVIDELNRGNVAKVFGELYFLLEYRDEEMRLQYGGDPFRLPRNLLFICTMNTADRSIALMDAALRRRFYFAQFFPNEPPIEGLLRRWLDEHAPEMAEHVAGLVDRANELLDRDAAIGPSYFMRSDLDEDRVRRIWSRAVIPYVEEQCFGDEDKLKQLQYDSLMKEQATEAAPPPDGEEPDADADAP